MIRAGWVRALTVMSIAAILAGVAATVTASQLQISIDARYYSGDAGSLSVADGLRLLQDQILAESLRSMVGSLALAGVLVGVAALALHSHRATRRVLTEVR